VACTVSDATAPPLPLATGRFVSWSGGALPGIGALTGFAALAGIAIASVAKQAQSGNRPTRMRVLCPLRAMSIQRPRYGT
jgi:hypothetical protein